MFRFPSVICTRCTGFFCLAIIKGSPNDIYCIIEEPSKHYFIEKSSHAQNYHKKLCLAAHKLLLLKSCYEECLLCVITILVVCISAPLAIKPAPDTVPSMVILSKNACSSKQSDHLFSIYRHKNIRINYTNPFCLDKMLRKYLRLQNNVLHHQCILFQLHISVLIPSYQKNV